MISLQAIPPALTKGDHMTTIENTAREIQSFGEGITSEAAVRAARLIRIEDRAYRAGLVGLPADPAWHDHALYHHRVGLKRYQGGL